MSELSKSEYHVLYCFYQCNQSLTKHELLEKIPDLNKNTTATVIRSLLEKGYLKVEEIRYSQNVLARAYRPCVSFIEFLKDEYGEVAVENLFKKAINSLENIHEIEYLLDLISKKENALIKNG
ncbi:BlaI/MecI/CopY family transcriptional regulator [Enterococcus casseliflavus]|uniref:BlaI/MecI/CopY family transcriptional regulator n=1 Tax=Enterococcus casseliflavus TaxID=37734 RepID=UPI00119F19E8|nr:BlaI/MecI/CopY family transcriptional regulator [Enterococcus casseliflavus]